MRRTLSWLLSLAFPLATAHADPPTYLDKVHVTSNGGIPHIGLFSVEVNTGPGALTVNLFPAAAVQHGAQFTIAGETLASGSKLSIVAGTYQITFTPAVGYFTPKPFSLTVAPGAKIELNFSYLPKPLPHILSTALPRAVVGAAYDATLVVSGHPTTITLSGLPTGLQDLGGGHVAGTPQSAGTSTVTAMAQNTNGQDTAMLPLAVSDPGAIGSGNLEIAYDSAGGMVEPLAAATHQVPQGEALTLFARPLPGYVFTGWQGSGLVELPQRVQSLQFTMPAAAHVEARFVRNPYPALAGSYETNVAGGRIQLRLLGTGLFTAKLQGGGVARKGVSFLGYFGGTGMSTITTTADNDRSSGTPVQKIYQLKATLDFDHPQIGVSVESQQAGSGIGSSQLGDAQPRASAAFARPYVGRYTAALVTSAPNPHGFGTFTVSPFGTVRFAGVSTSGEAITAAGMLDAMGHWAFYAEPPVSTYPLSGAIAFAGTDASGLVIQPTFASANFQASRFRPAPLLGYTTATGSAGGGALTTPLALALTLSPGGHVTDSTSGFHAGIDPLTGRLLHAGFPNPVGGAPAKVRGVILQKSQQAYGQHSLGDANGLPGYVQWQATP